MLPVSQRHATTAASSPSAAPAETGGPTPTSRPAANPDGLPARGLPPGDAPPRTTLASLPPDVHRRLGQYLDARSALAFGSTSQTHRAAMAELPGFDQIGRLFPAVEAARTAAEFEQAFTAIGASQDGRFRTEALQTLALRFVHAHAAMPPLDALAAP
jgi:hypothetical protein